MDDIRVGSVAIGETHDPFIIAELGYNFLTTDQALQAVDAAAGAGVQALKIQTFRAENVVARGFDFPPEAGGSNQFDEFKRFEISEETHARIFDRCRLRGLVPLSTPSHADDVDLLDRLGVELYKIGSDDLTNLPFLEHVARRGKPILLSSGMATLEEVEEALQTVRRCGNPRIVLMQCVSNYPIRDPRLVNLKVIPAFRGAFGVQVGFSDHTDSATAALGAVALGAVVIEKHFTASRSIPVPDAPFSFEPTEMGHLVRQAREMKAMLGSSRKEPVSTEHAMRRFARKSVIARRTLRPGERISREDIAVKRPATGIPPKFASTVVGRVARREIRADEPITWEML